MCRLVIERSCPLACAESTRTDWASRAREEKGVELARLLEQIESPQCGDDALPWSPVLPAVFDDLEVGASTGLLGAEEHGALVFETP